MIKTETEYNIKKIIRYKGYDLNDIYRENKRTMVSFTCDKGHENKCRQESLNEKYVCNECKKEETKKQIIDTFNDNGFKIIGEIINKNTPIDVICKNGHKSSMLYDNVKRGVICRECSIKKMSNEEEYVKNKINEKHNGYKLITPYKNSYSTITIECDRGHLFDTTFNRFMQKSGKCNICKDIDKTNEITELLKSIDYKFISKVNNGFSKIIVECNNGHITEMSYHDLKYGHRCQYCVDNNIKYDYEYVENYFKHYDYILLSKEYINNKTNLNVLCPNGHEYKTRFDVFKRGIRCPECNKSSGEIRIAEILTDNNIDFEFQKIFDGCKDKMLLPFDFYIKDKNTICEFDGKQHYEPIDWFGGHESYENTVKHDKIKNAYCKEHNIKLIRIPYWDFNNIEQILKDNNVI